VKTDYKFVPFEELPRLRERHRDQKIVQCHGAFDLVHMGHLIHFEEAKSFGDLLVVTITADRYITKKRSITFSEQYRARQVAALEVVDYVAVVPEPSALQAIDALRPDVYVKGPEYANLLLDKSRSIFHETQLLESYGAAIRFTAGETFSSTKLSHFLLSSPEAAQDSPLLRNEKVLFKDVSKLGFTLEQLKLFLAQVSPLRVCVIGEAIVDEWVDVELTSLSTQSRCVAGVEAARVRQVGGAGIIARHLAAFVSEVECFSNRIVADVPAHLRVHELSPTELLETRFVDQANGRPLFKSKSPGLAPIEACALPHFDDYDVVLIADYGHGLLSPAPLNARIAAAEGGAYVAAMAQVNSSNYGYNLPLKYVGADYYSLNRTEAELCLHERHLALPELADHAARALKCRALSVTDGANGAITQIGCDRFIVPSLSASVVDTVGCGDAFFALSAIAAAVNTPAPVVALVGSIAAAAMAQRRCNESPVTEQEFLTIGKIVI
jgi:cytidyltransferase-like protein